MRQLAQSLPGGPLFSYPPCSIAMTKDEAIRKIERRYQRWLATQSNAVGRVFD
jgi:hypothetical protein